MLPPIAGSIAHVSMHRARPGHCAKQASSQAVVGTCRSTCRQCKSTDSRQHTEHITPSDKGKASPRQSPDSPPFAHQNESQHTVSPVVLAPAAAPKGDPNRDCRPALAPDGAIASRFSSSTVSSPNQIPAPFHQLRHSRSGMPYSVVRVYATPYSLQDSAPRAVLLCNPHVCASRRRCYQGLRAAK